MKTGSFKRLTREGALLLIAILAAGAAAETCAQTAQSTAKITIGDDSPNGRCAPEVLDQAVADCRSSTEATKEADALTAWIAEQTGWPVRAVPPIRLVPREEIKNVFGKEMASDLNVEALHSNKDHIVYLLESWRPGNLRDRSILLHELVHHLQYLNNVKTVCHAEEERQAYDLQIKWLREHGVDDPLGLIGVNRLFLYLLSCDKM
jgi:hypothetical protein